MVFRPVSQRVRRGTRSGTLSHCRGVDGIVGQNVPTRTFHGLSHRSRAVLVLRRDVRRFRLFVEDRCCCSHKGDVREERTNSVGLTPQRSSPPVVGVLFGLLETPGKEFWPLRPDFTRRDTRVVGPLSSAKCVSGSGRQGPRGRMVPVEGSVVVEAE